MKFRIALIVTFLIAGATYLSRDNCIIACLYFGLALITLMEATIVNRYYRLKGFQLGDASEFSLMTTEDNLNLETLTIPISLKRPYWYPLKAFRVYLISDNVPIASEVYTASGGWFEGQGTEFTLDWEHRKGFIAIAHLSGEKVMIGTPIEPIQIGQKGRYKVTVEIRKNDKVLASQSYILFYQNKLQLLKDNAK